MTTQYTSTNRPWFIINPIRICNSKYTAFLCVQRLRSLLVVIIGTHRDYNTCVGGAFGAPPPPPLGSDGLASKRLSSIAPALSTCRCWSFRSPRWNNLLANLIACWSGRSVHLRDALVYAHHHISREIHGRSASLLSSAEVPSFRGRRGSPPLLAVPSPGTATGASPFTWCISGSSPLRHPLLFPQPSGDYTRLRCADWKGGSWKYLQIDIYAIR